MKQSSTGVTAARRLRSEPRAERSPSLGELQKGAGRSTPRVPTGASTGPRGEIEAVEASTGLIEAASALARGPALAAGRQAFAQYLFEVGAVMSSHFGVELPSSLTPVASQAARLGLEPELCVAFLGGWFDLEPLPT